MTLGLGQTKTCTFVNDDNAPALYLKKHVVNDNGGTQLAGDWTLSAGAYDVTGSESGAKATDQVGTYDLSETIIAGYTNTSLTCDDNPGVQVDSVTLGLGQTKTCTFVNDDNAAHLTLIKRVDNGASGYTTAATEWMLAATGPTSITGKTGGAAVTDAPVSAGSYALTESGPAGYTASAWSCVGGTQEGASVTLALAESATCTITNTLNKAELTLQKTWINAAKGDSTTLTIDGQPTEEPVVSTASGIASETDEVNTVVADVYAGQTVDLGESLGATKGSYTVNLTCTDKDGLSYEGGYNGEFTMPLEPADVVCTFTNTRTSNALVLQKQWINGADGDTAALTIEGGLDDPAEATSTSDGSAEFIDGENQASTLVYSGDTVSVSEVLGENLGTYTSALVCTDGESEFTPEEGTFEMPNIGVICTITNTRTVGDLVVKKVVVGPIAGASTDFTVNVDCTPGEAYDKTGVVLNQANNWTVTYTGIPTGVSCVVTEPVRARWLGADLDQPSRGDHRRG